MANPSTPPAVPGTEKNNGCGCFGIGCGLLILALVAGCALGYGIFAYLKSWTSEESAEIPVVLGTDQEWEALNKKVGTYAANSRAGQAATLELTDRELNILIARHPSFEMIKSRAYLQIADGLLNAKISLPLTGIPGFAGRFLNGDAKIQAEVENGTPKFKIMEIKVTGQVAPAEFLKAFEEGFIKEFTATPETQAGLDKFKSIKFQGNSLIIESKAGPSAMPETAATPDQVEAGTKSPETPATP